MAIALGKLSPDDSPLGEPKGMLLKIYNGSDSALKVFDVSSVTPNSGFSRLGCCLSNAPCNKSERVTVVQILRICIIVPERMILTTGA